MTELAGRSQPLIAADRRLSTILVDAAGSAAAKALITSPPPRWAWMPRRQRTTSPVSPCHLRQIKDEGEIELIKKAIGRLHAAQRAMMQCGPSRA